MPGLELGAIIALALSWLAWRVRLVFLLHRHEGWRRMLFDFGSHLKTEEDGVSPVYIGMGNLVAGLEIIALVDLVWLRILLYGIQTAANAYAVRMVLHLDRELREATPPPDYPGDCG